ncbi:MAG: CBS domain-containing protein, partial [Actinobacteria bacterium]|nr:CBS domain-containing protein [Actinomycetota bacterium]
MLQVRPATGHRPARRGRGVHMHESLRFGTFRGIAIGCNWSVLAIAALLAWGLADGFLPAEAPGYRPHEYWIVGVAGMVLFLGALLAHELGHSLVALRRDVAVESITLWLFGGVARLRGEARTPRDELAIAIAGPAVSLAGALSFGTAAVVLDGRGPDIVVVVLAWLALVNGMLVVFNLAPAAPLDGGRVLHAVVWGATHDRARATRTATTAGKGFGFLLIGLGGVLLVNGDIGGAWIGLVGWFVIAAASAEATHALLTTALAGIRVRDVMTADPITVRDDVPLDVVVADVLLTHHCSTFPVVDGAGETVGLLTLRRVRAVPDEQRPRLVAGDVAVPLAATAIARPDDSIAEMLEHSDPDAPGDGRMLVFEHGRLVG